MFRDAQPGASLAGALQRRLGGTPLAADELVVAALRERDGTTVRRAIASGQINSSMSTRAYRVRPWLPVDRTLVPPRRVFARFHIGAAHG